TGVSMAPCGVWRIPARARVEEHSATTSNSTEGNFDCKHSTPGSNNSWRIYGHSRRTAFRSRCIANWSLIRNMAESLRVFQISKSEELSGGIVARRLSLIVDDDPAIRTFVRTILEAEQFEAVEADGGRAALAMAKALH